jgi:hypothetical protein
MQVLSKNDRYVGMTQDVPEGGCKIVAVKKNANEWPGLTHGPHVGRRRNRMN